MGMVDAVAELHAHDIVHRNLIPSNIAIFSNQATEIFLKDFRLSASTRDIDKATSLPHSIYTAESKSWVGESKNFDKYSIGVIILAWYLSNGKCKF